MQLKQTCNMIACLEFDHGLSDLNQQQIDSRYHSTVNLTRNMVK